MLEMKLPALPGHLSWTAVRERADDWLWRVTPGGLISIVLIAAVLAGCAAPLPQAGAASHAARDCVLGVNHASQMLDRETFRDPVDSLITASIDQGRDTWACPPEQAPRRLRDRAASGVDS